MPSTNICKFTGDFEDKECSYVDKFPRGDNTISQHFLNDGKSGLGS